MPRPLAWFPRPFLLVREAVEQAIYNLSEQETRAAALALVDAWAERVIAAHLGSEHFGLRSRAEFLVAHTTPYFGMLAAGPSGPPWRFQVECLMRDQLRFWIERSARFPTELRFEPAPDLSISFP